MIPSAFVILLLAYPPVVAFIAALYLLFPSLSMGAMSVIFCGMLLFPLSIMGIVSLLSRHISAQSETPVLSISGFVLGVCFMLDPLRGVDVFARGAALLQGAGSVPDVAVIGVLFGQCLAMAAAVYVLLAVAQLSIELPCRWFFSVGGVENVMPWELVRMLTVILLLSLSGVWIFEELLRSIAAPLGGV